MNNFDFGAFRVMAPCENCKDAYPIARLAYIKMCKASGYKRYIPVKDTRNSYDYIMFAGETKDNLQPMSAWKSAEEAIRAAAAYSTINSIKCVEVTFMPEDDDDINEVVWSNCERSNENAE